MKFTTLTCRAAVLLLAVTLASCASTSRQAEEEQARIAAQQAQLEEQARLQAQQQEEARRRAEQEQREQAERQQRLAAEQAAREEAERQAAQAAERERVAAEQRRQEQARQAAERAQVVARQQARVAELRAQIAANNQEAANLDSASGALREAVSRAEELTTLLNEEQAKYDDVDPATGQPRSALAKERIEQLSTEIERLRTQAAAVSAP